MKHFLISIFAGQYNVHTYLMTDDRRYLDHAIKDMVDHFTPSPPAVLCTHLDPKAVKLVRNILTTNHPPAQQVLAQATDYHRSMFELLADCPNDRTLMNLH